MSRQGIRDRRKAVWGATAAAALMLAAAGLSASCGDLTRQGQASSYLVVTSLQGASGAKPDTFGTFLLSDVVTVVNSSSTIFNDVGQAAFQLALKDPGSSASPNAPTPNNMHHHHPVPRRVHAIRRPQRAGRRRAVRVRRRGHDDRSATPARSRSRWSATRPSTRRR